MKTLLVAGGSGGHLIPALVLAEDLQKEGGCSLLTTQCPVDQTLRSQSAVDWVTTDLRPFTPLWRWFSPRFSAGQLRAIRGIWRAIRRNRPDVVIGFGGYLSAVGLTAARLARLPTVVHEQNLLPGRANRLLARWADAVAVSFQETRRYLPAAARARVEVTGNPIRSLSDGSNLKEPLDPFAYFGFDRQRPVLLVMGGSQGSKVINSLATRMWADRSLADRQGIQVIHVAGTSAAAGEVEEGYRRLEVTARAFSFLHEMPLAYRAATLAIGRAGATTIAELVEFKLPAILVPYPYAGGHQKANAEWMESIGGAKVIQQAGLTPASLAAQVEQLLSEPVRLEQMRQALKGRADGSATERLAALVRRVAQGMI